MIFSGRNQGYNCGSAFLHQFDHFWALNDVTVAVRNRTSQIFLELFIDWSAIGNRDQRKENWRGSRLLISSFDFRRSLHSGFDHIKAENDVTVAVRSRFSIFFVQKIVTLILGISLTKYEFRFHVLQRQTSIFLPQEQFEPKMKPSYLTIQRVNMVVFWLLSRLTNIINAKIWFLCNFWDVFTNPTPLC